MYFIYNGKNIVSEHTTIKEAVKSYQQGYHVYKGSPTNHDEDITVPLLKLLMDVYVIEGKIEVLDSCIVTLKQNDDYYGASFLFNYKNSLERELEKIK